MEKIERRQESFNTKFQETDLEIEKLQKELAEIEQTPNFENCFFSMKEEVPDLVVQSH